MPRAARSLSPAVLLAAVAALVALSLTALPTSPSGGFVPAPAAAAQEVRLQPERALLAAAAAGLLLGSTPVLPAFADSLDKFTEDELNALQVYTSPGRARSVAAEIATVEALDPKPNDSGDPREHIPRVTYSKDGSMTLTVQHVMDPGIVKDGYVEVGAHYIEYIWLQDAETGRILAARNFEATDASPPFLVTTLRKGKAVVPYSFCNLNGVWKGEKFMVP